ncbi:predicted protein [Nematostella vectensis]|uniref:Uncharacterized protein n=1 Tax=Nematostella vectensis TaxID=45351 RepID=A7RFL9_NEMVE|nr:retinol dehydrogenase 7 [Nematostella vectensis]EDO49744.1 predicted protein [Nematostella vectensis]|eukprot:XP_001641807.1 predicted protein [Nematostella vectensis]
MDASILWELSLYELALAVFVVLLLTCLLLKLLLPTRRVGDYHTKYVLITGCDSGFGRDLAIRLDGMGFHVFGACLTQQGIQELEQTCSKRTVGLLMDVTNHLQIVQAFERVKKALPPGIGLWALANNAGYGACAPIEWYPLSHYKRMADVNLWGVVDVSKTFLPLVKMARGRVVNISSIYGFFSPIFGSHYAITKYGVEAFSDSMRREMARWGVRVSLIEPAAFRTLLWTKIAADLTRLWEALSQDLKDEYGGELTLNKQIQKLKSINEQASPHLYKVVDALVDAITSRDPKPRYLVGFQAKLLGLISLLPTSWADAIIER